MRKSCSKLKFSLEGIAQKIECPVLILHGESDRVVPLAEAINKVRTVPAESELLLVARSLGISLGEVTHGD